MISIEKWQKLMGCEIYAHEVMDTSDIENRGKLVDIRNGWLRIKYTEYNPGRWFQMKDCKPVFRALYTMTSKEERVFKNMVDKHAEFNYELYAKPGSTQMIRIYYYKEDRTVERMVSDKEMTWLITRFYLGQCDAEDCLMEG